MSESGSHNRGRERAKVRSSDAAVFKAVQHELALEEKAEREAEREAGREAKKKTPQKPQRSVRAVRTPPQISRPRPSEDNSRRESRKSGFMRPAKVSGDHSQTNLPVVPSRDEALEQDEGIVVFGDDYSHENPGLSESEFRELSAGGYEDFSGLSGEGEDLITCSEEIPQRRVSGKSRKKLNQKEYGVSVIRKRRSGVLVLLAILLFEVLAAVVALQAITIFNEDTEMIVRSQTIEAGDTANLQMYVPREPRFPEYSSCNLDFGTINYTLPQTIRFTVSMYGINFPCVLSIVDTTPPTADGIAHTMFSVDPLPPVEECVTNIFDLNDVSVDWYRTPYYKWGGDFTAQAIVKDSSGNQTLVDVPLHVTRDIIPPTIEGTQDIKQYAGDPLKFRDGVTITDDIDQNPKLDIDTAGADLSKPGKYTVYYVATDFTGNETRVPINVTLWKKPRTYVEPDVVYAEARKILNKITWDGMSDMQKALQITWWCRYNIYYVSNCDDSSWTRAAYDGFTKRSGNCYTYAMCARALFDVAGIENMVIVRHPYIHNPHFWNYININGEWYHCDSTPRMGYDSYFFMYTTKELKNFWHNGWNGYNFDESKYPKSATTSVQSKISYWNHSIK